MSKFIEMHIAQTCIVVSALCTSTLHFCVCRTGPDVALLEKKFRLRKSKWRGEFGKTLFGLPPGVYVGKAKLLYFSVGMISIFPDSSYFLPISKILIPFTFLQFLFKESLLPFSSKYSLNTSLISFQEVTKRCRLSWLTNSALV